MKRSLVVALIAVVALVASTAVAAAEPVQTVTIGSSGTGDGEFELPTGIDFQNGGILVVDAENHRIQRFSETGSYQIQLGSEGTGDGKFMLPLDVAYDSNGYFWVTDYETGYVQKFAFLGGTGVFAGKFGGPGSGNGQFAGAGGIAISHNTGSIWVTDVVNQRIQQFNSSGGFVRAVGAPGSGDGKFSAPFGIAVSEGHVWVADTGNNRIQEFSSTGEFLSKFGTAGEGEGQLAAPVAIDVSDTGTLWVTDLSGRVQEFAKNGTYLGKIGATFSEPRGIATGPSDSIFVSDSGNDQVQKWQEPSKPSATTDDPTGVARTTATLNGEVNPKGFATSYRFEYGPTTSYGTEVPIPDEELGAGGRTIAVDEDLSGLTPGLTYHYRVAATNTYGTTFGSDQTFTTTDARWLKGGKQLTADATPNLEGTFSVNGVSCPAKAPLAMEPGHAGTVTSFSVTTGSCTISGNLKTWGCTGVSSVTTANTPWNAEIVNDGGLKVAVSGVDLTYKLTGGLFCPKEFTVSGTMYGTPDNASSMGSLTMSGLLTSSKEWVSGDVSGNLSVKPGSTYGIALANARWAQEGKQLTTSPNVTLSGTFATGGGVECPTSAFLSLEPASGGSVTGFSGAAGSCSLVGTLKAVGCKSVKSVTANTLPWSGYLAKNSAGAYELALYDLSVSYSLEGGFFCPAEYKVDGTVIATPNEAEGIDSFGLSGTLVSSLGGNTSASGTLSVTPANTYEIE